MTSQEDIAKPLNAPVVMACGFLCDRLIWEGVRARLEQGTIQDFSGFDSLKEMAQALLDVAPPRFILAGHSMGGRVALEAWRLAPERIVGLVLANTGIHPVQQHEAAGRGRLVQLARDKGMRALADE